MSQSGSLLSEYECRLMFDSRNRACLYQVTNETLTYECDGLGEID